MKKRLDLSLYLVLDPILCKGIRGMVETTKIAIQQGVSIVQLRSTPAFSHRHRYEAALALKAVLADTAVPLIINDNVDIALAVDADGVHIGQQDLPASVVRQLIGYDKFLGLSISNQQELEQSFFLPVDYFGVGPVYPTTSKKNAAPAIGTSILANLIKCCPHPAVAIGGINACNVAEVIQTGVDGIAVVSAICGQAEVKQSTSKLHQLSQQNYTRLRG